MFDVMDGDAFPEKDHEGPLHYIEVLVEIERLKQSLVTCAFFD